MKGWEEYHGGEGSWTDVCLGHLDLVVTRTCVCNKRCVGRVEAILGLLILSFERDTNSRFDWSRVPLGSYDIPKRRGRELTFSPESGVRKTLDLCRARPTNGPANKNWTNHGLLSYSIAMHTSPLRADCAKIRVVLD